jgi:hypothetical protein
MMLKENSQEKWQCHCDHGQKGVGCIHWPGARLYQFWLNPKPEHASKTCRANERIESNIANAIDHENYPWVFGGWKTVQASGAYLYWI